MKEKLTNAKGIALILLIIVIVIIVLISIAGITISMMSKGNGAIFNETKTEYGKYDEPYIPAGFKYKEGTWNSGYTIIGDTVSKGSEFVWVPCVTKQSKVKEGDTVVTFEKTITGIYNQESLKLSITDNNVKDVDPTEAIRKSVEKYDGFYIAKYEAGLEKDMDDYDTRDLLTDGSIKPVSKKGCRVWTDITRPGAINVSAAMVNTTDGVKSGLISGECWDTTLQWMVKASSNKDSKPNLKYDIDSTGNGWYDDVSKSKVTTTGYKAVNNIYDMAGNVWEWTTENCIDKRLLFVKRGGYYVNSGSQCPAAYRVTMHADFSYNTGFRVVLYKEK